MDMRHLGVPTSTPSNNIYCLLTVTSYHHDVKRGPRFGAIAVPKPLLRLIYFKISGKSAKLAKN